MKHPKNPGKKKKKSCKLFFSGLHQVLIKPGRRQEIKVIAKQGRSLRVAQTDPKVFFILDLHFKPKQQKNCYSTGKQNFSPSGHRWTYSLFKETYERSFWRKGMKPAVALEATTIPHWSRECKLLSKGKRRYEAQFQLQ